MRQVKLATAIVLLLAVFVVIVQNWSPVKANLLFWAVEPPLAALLLGTLLAGYGLGLLTTALLKVRTWRSEALAARKQAALGKDMAKPLPKPLPKPEEAEPKST